MMGWPLLFAFSRTFIYGWEETLLVKIEARHSRMYLGWEESQNSLRKYFPRPVCLRCSGKHNLSFPTLPVFTLRVREQDIENALDDLCEASRMMSDQMKLQNQISSWPHSVQRTMATLTHSPTENVTLSEKVMVYCESDSCCKSLW